MATVMEFTSPTEEFPLGSVFQTLPEVTVELERIIPNDTLTIPYFWVRGTETADIEAAFEAHAGVRNIELVDCVGNEYLMRAEWGREYVGILDGLAAIGLVVLSVIGTNDGWRFEVRGEDRAAIGAFHTYCQERDIPIEITAIHALFPTHNGDHKLTDAQRESLTLAYEAGYFESPSESSLEEIADVLGITQQSLSARLKRGHRRLIDTTLKDE
ncbi:MAG: helix-turn-helix domain-containing protein [Natronomonas sp.]